MRTLRLLAIGNSLAQNPLTYLNEIAASTGQVRFVVGQATLGGCPLQKHWNIAEYTARVPEYKPYQFETGGGTWPGYTGRAVNLQDALAAEPWDLVTLNHASIPGPRRETWQPWIGRLHALVRERAPQAEIVLNQTWAYREDAVYLIENGLTQETMFEKLRDNYAHFGRELGCRVIPTGEAIQRFRRLPGRKFSFPDPEFDYANAVAPALPRQENSLSVGWNWVINESPDGIPKMTLDANHLNTPGLYLAGLTWFEYLTGLDARGVTFAPEGLGEGDIALLRGTAHDACAGNHPASKP